VQRTAPYDPNGRLEIWYRRTAEGVETDLPDAIFPKPYGFVWHGNSFWQNFINDA